MKLIDCEPRWTKVTNPDMGGDAERQGMGLSFLPVGFAGRINIWFENPLDGKPPINEPEKPRTLWKRKGETFDTLTLAPSIRDDSQGFHKTLTNGVFA